MHSLPIRYLSRVAPFVLLAVAVGWLASPGPAAPTEPIPDLNARFGLPSDADKTKHDDYLMDKKYFVLSYNNKLGIPNWVSWRLVKDDIGSHPRFPFHPDEELPEGFKKVVTGDYARTGFDRGHMCNHEDRASSDASSEATFVLTNIIPQAPINNQEAWEHLEDYCRSLAKQGNVLYIVCGPQGKGGEGTQGLKSSIAGGKINVPAKTWKVVLVLGSNNKVDKHTRMIGVVMPNDQSVGKDWARFRVPVKDIEELTGYTFFNKATDAEKTIIEPLKEEADSVRIRPVRSSDE
jgi:endonuclease G